MTSNLFLKFSSESKFVSLNFIRATGEKQAPLEGNSQDLLQLHLFIGHFLKDLVVPISV